MMSSIPPAAANDVATLLQVIADPKGTASRLEAIKAAHDDLDARAAMLNDYETKLRAREAAVVKLEQAVAAAEDAAIAAGTALEDSKAQHEAEKAAFDAAKAKELAAQEVTRLNVNRDAGANKAAAHKLAAQRDEMASQEVAIQAMRVGLEEREKAVVEGESALAAKQARLAEAMKA